jgi:hypothetical protein
VSLPFEFRNLLNSFDLSGGADETRTRDLRRDRLGEKAVILLQQKGIAGRWDFG